MQSSDTGIPTQSVWLKDAWQASNYRHAWDVFWERVEVEVFRVGVGGEVGQYNRMYTYIYIYMGLK